MLLDYLKPISDDAPSGENLEYHSDFTALELAAQPGEERQVGDTIIEAQEPDHRDVIEKALRVLEQSHDLRAASYLALARLRSDGLPGFAEVLEYVDACLTDYWASCHPQLDADDDDDPTMRVNAVRTLSDANTMVRALRLAPLTQSRNFGQFSLRDIAIAEGEMSVPANMDTVPDMSTIGAAFQDTAPDKLASLLDAARSALDHARAIDNRFDEMTPGQGPDLDPLIKTLRQIATRLTTATGGEAEPTPAAEVGGPVGPMPSGGDSAPRGPAGSISSQADVIAALDRINAYYARYEPSSPLPLMINRCKRLVGADFLTIMRDMAPDGISNVNRIGGLEDD
jgi:type VI secretion system protein ImpA